MILEYLFLDNMMQKSVEEYTNKHEGKKKITVTFLRPETQDYLAVKYETPGENRESAKALSDFNKGFTDHFQPITLINESAEYYNRILYPLVNKFERLLRKLLYVKMAICDNGDMRSRIKDLESKDFGGISNLLFVDDAFCKTAKSQISKANSREDMLAILEELEEKTAWDIMVGKGTLSIVQENFEKLRNYRNDVMHAHNIGYEQFVAIQKIFDAVNAQLAKEIDKTIEFGAPSESSEELAATLNDRLNSEGALTVGEILAERFNAVREFRDGLSGAIENWHKWMEILNRPVSIPINSEIMEALTRPIDSTTRSNSSEEKEASTTLD